MNTITSYLSLVTNYTDNILQLQVIDSTHHTLPLLPIGIERTSKTSIKWNSPNSQTYALSNLSNQQNLLRILSGISTLTHNEYYCKTAKDILSYYFTYLQHTTGLLHWGGHRFLDLNTLAPTSVEGKAGMVHELKNCFPFYDLFFETNPTATIRLIHGIWNAHVYDFATLSINRHGYFFEKPSKLWSNPFKPLPLFSQTKGLSFINIGSDLIYAAGCLYLLAHEKGALLWMKRLAKQYVKARNNQTGLGAYQYTQALKLEDAPNDSSTQSKYGDRALRQLGPELGSNALEGNVLLAPQATSIYYHNAIMSLKLGARLGALGRFLIEDAKDGLIAYAKYAYNPDTNTFKPLLTDGTDLTGFKLMRDGYYGEAGKVLSPFVATTNFFYSYIEAYCLTQDSTLWQTARQIASNLGLGDIGKTLGESTSLNMNTSLHDEYTLFAFIRLFECSNCNDYKKIAITIADNLINAHYIDGYFVNSPNSKYVDFDSAKPLALLTLHGLLTNHLHSVPTYMTSSGYIHGNYLMADGTVKPYTSTKLLSETLS